jgi:hypothetical protein
MPKYIFTCITDKPMELLKEMPKEKFHLSLHYTTINRRINRLNIKVEDATTTDKESIKINYIIIAIYSTDIKITNRGQWLRDKWDIKKGYLKTQLQ